MALTALPINGTASSGRSAAYTAESETDYYRWRGRVSCERTPGDATAPHPTNAGGGCALALEVGYAQVRLTVQHATGGKVYFTPPKTALSQRRVALSLRAVEALRQHQLRQEQQKQVVGAAWQDNDLVFPNAVGEPQRGNHILQRNFAPLLKKAGLPPLRFHDLRHTTATLLKQKIHPKIVSEILGHSTISMTLDTYSHVMPDMQRDATEAFDLLFKGD